MVQMTPFLDQWCIPMVSIKFQKKMKTRKNRQFFGPKNSIFANLTSWFDVAIFDRRFSERNRYSSWENGSINLILFFKCSLGCPPQNNVGTFFIYCHNFSEDCIFWTPTVNFWPIFSEGTPLLKKTPFWP